MQWYQR